MPIRGWDSEMGFESGQLLCRDGQTVRQSLRTWQNPGKCPNEWENLEGFSKSKASPRSGVLKI
jgi:hypothetical protein